MGSHKQKKNKTGRKSTERTAKQQFSYKWIVLIIVVLAMAAGLIFYQFQPTESTQVPLSAAGQSKSGPTVEFHQLIGRWQRPDGGYVIEIRNINSGGSMEAAYFNPRPINVSRAEVFRNRGRLEVFLELRDTGYPGSTYTLTYNPQQDMMTGIYFQATMGQSFEVMFVRAK